MTCVTTFTDTDTSYILRLTGNSFYKFINGFKESYDRNFVTAMIKTMNDLVNEFPDCKTGYCHSDEISLYFPKVRSKKEYDSFLSLSMEICSVRFTYHINHLVTLNKKLYNLEFIDKLAKFNYTFDSIIITLSEDHARDVVNYFSKDYKRLGLNNQVPIYIKYGVYCKRKLYFKKEIEETCVKQKLINRCFKIDHTEPLVKLLQNKYWSNDLQQYGVDFYMIQTTEEDCFIQLMLEKN